MLLCSEESSAVPGVGVEKLAETGKLDFLKDGPLFWVDSADSQPCMAESSVATPPSVSSLLLTLTVWRCRDCLSSHVDTPC